VDLTILKKLAELFYFYIIFYNFPSIYNRFQILQNYTTTAAPHDVWVQTPYHMAVGGATEFQPQCGMAFVKSANVATPNVVPRR
jgi:hypothetical protein